MPSASNRTTSGTAPSNTPPRSNNNDQPPSQQDVFPPTKGIRWGTLKEVYNTKQCCIHCYSRDSFHWEVGCPFLASIGLVTTTDSAKAADITTQYAAHTNRPNSSNGTPRRRTSNNNRRNRSANNATATPANSDQPRSQPDADAASGRRADSSERPPPTSNRTMYPDNDSLSSDDDNSFQMGITGTGQDSSSAGNSNNTNSALYPIGVSTNYSTNYNASNSSQPPLSISTELSTAAVNALTRSPNCVFAPDYNDWSEECCADSDATHMMLPDYMAFNSYRKHSHRTVKLGDKSTLRIAGEGTATFSLNGKVITVRNALHVPDIRQPLYSLRKRKTMPGCGTFGHHDWLVHPLPRLRSPYRRFHRQSRHIQIHRPPETSSPPRLR